MSIKLASDGQSIKGAQSVYLGTKLVYGKPVVGAFETKYIDFKQSTYTSGSLIWSSSNMVNSPISGVFTASPVIESQSVKFNGTLELNATYISQSYAHTDWTVVAYYKSAVSVGNVSNLWEHGSGFPGNPGQAKRIVNDAGDTYWILSTGGTGAEYGFNEVSGASFINSNFIVDTITCSGSTASQYENGVLTQTQNVGSNGSWAYGATNGLKLRFSNNNTWVKRVQVYNKALTQAEVVAVYYDIINGNN
jgi:hypothetical protein